MPKVFDCFAFFNEFELLELRLRELDSVVDHFVLVEATRTFQKKAKPLYYDENKERFKDFSHKIIHVVVDQYPNFFTKFRIPKPFDYDNGQKEFILKGLSQAKDNDVIIVSDLDELPLAEKILEYKDQPGIHVFEQYLCFYYLNCVCTHLNGGDPQLNKNGYGYWRGSVMLQKKAIQSIKATRMYRDLYPPKVNVIEKAGWHLSYMGGVEQIIKKLESWTHPEYNTPEINNPDHIKKSIREGKSIFDPTTTFKLEDIETSKLPFPKILKENLDHYSEMILRP
jgi:beta-1,4-mannosyl-glycoprotein beta-1,4-N-acetylglucosaminyltransferase